MLATDTDATTETSKIPDGSPPPAPSDSTAILFLVMQLICVAGFLAYGAQRFRDHEAAKIVPSPRLEPIRIRSLHDRPEVVSDEQLSRVLTKLQPKLRGPEPKINHVDHALRFWGIQSTFPDENSLSGLELRGLLTDHRAFRGAWGKKAKPFLLPNTRAEGTSPGLSFRTRAGDATSSHVDHTLACLAEVGTSLDYPVQTPSGELPLRAAFNQALERFSLNQAEYEWSVLVFLHYMPEVAKWHTAEGQEVTWDRLAERLMRQRLSQGTCYGNHRLFALAAMLQLDPEFHLLSDKGRSSVVAFLKDVTARLAKMQNEEGYWDGAWPGPEIDGPQTPTTEAPYGPHAERLLMTGHTLEWWAIAPKEVHPDDAVLLKASQWLVKSLDELSESDVRRMYPFLTHAGRSLALWRNREPSEVIAALPAPSVTTPAAESKPDTKPESTQGEASKDAKGQ
jgi:hypothetical protein